MKFEIKIKGKRYQVKILEYNEKTEISINEKKFIFPEKQEENLQKEQILIKSLSKKEKLVKAPLPGVVSNIFVKEGEEVKKGDRLLTEISMKMENEIVSDYSGIVKEIKVKENQAVEKDQILLIIK